MKIIRIMGFALVLAMFSVNALASVGGGDPLPSWNNTAIKQKIITFVSSASNPKSKEYIKPKNRIALLNAEGTLWVEKPYISEISFIRQRLEQIKSAVPSANKYLSILNQLDKNTLRPLDAQTEINIIQAALNAFPGETSAAYANAAAKFLHTAKDQTFNVKYTALGYQPMAELIAYLQANGFTVFISGESGTDFMRVYVPMLFNLPTENIIGTSINYAVAFREAKLVFLRQNSRTPPVAVHEILNFFG